MTEKEVYRNVFDKVAEGHMRSLDVSDVVGQRAGAKKVFRMAALSKMAAVVAIFMLTGVTVFAAQYNILHLKVNGNDVPELNQMEIAQVQAIDAQADEYGIVKKEYSSYDDLTDELHIHLLDSSLAVDNPYMQASIETDNENYAMVRVNNYIIGDTSNFRIVEGNYYNYDHGKEYYSPVSLEAALILSQEQLETGWNDEYLGYYEYVDSFISTQGYRVNIIQDTIGSQHEDFVPESCAVFVADGILYKVKGRISIDLLKSIVNGMQ